MGAFVFKLIVLIALIVYVLYYIVGVISIAHEDDER